MFTVPFLVTQHTPTVPQPIMSHCATWSGTYCSFASDEPCANFLDYHSYLAHLYLPFTRYKFPPEFRLGKFVWPDCFASFSSMCIHLTLHIHLAPFHVFPPSYIASPCSHTIFTHHTPTTTMPRDDPFIIKYSSEWYYKWQSLCISVIKYSYRNDNYMCDIQ